VMPDLFTLQILHSFPTRRSSDLEAIDPAFGEVRPQPVLLRRVPNMEVVVYDEQVLLLSVRRLGSDHEESPLTLGRMNGLAQLKRSEEHTSELQSRFDIVCRLLLE